MSLDAVSTNVFIFIAIQLKKVNRRCKCLVLLFCCLFTTNCRQMALFCFNQANKVSIAIRTWHFILFAKIHLEKWMTELKWTIECIFTTFLKWIECRWRKEVRFWDKRQAFIFILLRFSLPLKVRIIKLTSCQLSFKKKSLKYLQTRSTLMRIYMIK